MLLLWQRAFLEPSHEAVILGKESTMERTPEEIRAYVRNRYAERARQVAEASC